jgi:hypothetical protein
MDKKDIYEHLAKIYLDASSKRKKKQKSYPKLFKNLFFLSLACICVLGIFSFARTTRNKSPNSEIALLLCPDVVKINFHFDPARKETYSVALNKLDLSRYKALAFSAKKTNYDGDIALRVEFTTRFKEKSEKYLRDIPNRWQEYKINLSDFAGINDWSSMSGLSFVIEEWNVQKKRGIVYIDNVRFIK